MTALADAVKTRHSEQYLIELTNDQGSATTINTVVLEAAAADSIGVFQIETGVTFDATNSTHLVICVDGVMGKLEQYKARDGNIMSLRWKNFLGALMGFRKKESFLPQSNSKISPSSDSIPVRPDFDRKSRAFRGGSVSSKISETADYD